jgi:hypothetical protein
MSRRQCRQSGDDLVVAHCSRRPKREDDLTAAHCSQQRKRGDDLAVAHCSRRWKRGHLATDESSRWGKLGDDLHVGNAQSLQSSGSPSTGSPSTTSSPIGTDLELLPSTTSKRGTHSQTITHRENSTLLAQHGENGCLS